MGDNSRQVWLNVEDTAAWVRADTTSDPQAATVTLKRRDNQQEVSLPQAEFARLAQCYTSEVDEVADDLTRMGEVSDATMLDTLRRRYARDDIYCAVRDWRSNSVLSHPSARSAANVPFDPLLEQGGAG